MRMWVGAALAGAMMVAAPANAAVKVLFMAASDSESIDRARSDILGNDARFDLSNSASFSSNGNPAPTLAYLQQFDSVLVWSNSAFTADYNQVLGSYANSGRGVVLSTFWGQNNSGDVGGINATGLNPLTTSDFSAAYVSRALGLYDTSSPFMQGVTTLSASNYNGEYLPGTDAGAQVVASWDDGNPLVAVNARGNVAAVTLFPEVADYQHASGDYRPLFTNALYQVSSVAAAPEPATWAMMIVGFGIAGGALRRSRKLRPTSTKVAFA